MSMRTMMQEVAATIQQDQQDARAFGDLIGPSAAEAVYRNEYPAAKIALERLDFRGLPSNAVDAMSLAGLLLAFAPERMSAMLNQGYECSFTRPGHYSVHIWEYYRSAGFASLKAHYRTLNEMADGVPTLEGATQLR